MITITKGETKTWSFTVKEDNVLMDLTGCRIYMNIQSSGVVYQIANAAGAGSDALVSITGTGAVDVTCAHDVSVELIKGTWPYDLWVVTPAGRYILAIEDELQVLQSVGVDWPTP